MKRHHLTRRNLLAGFGAISLTSLAGLGLFTEPALGFTESTTLASVDGATLVADWRETYNGTVLENTRVTPSDSGAALSLSNVLPGDNGVLSVRVRVTEDTATDSEPSGVDPRLTLSLSETAENSRSEPERVAGDTSAEKGELHEFIEMAVWYDSGLADVNAFGANNSEQDIGERLVQEDAAGTLKQVANSVDDVSLAPQECLSVGESVVVSLGWSFVAGDDHINVAQGDSVTFDCHVDGTRCGGSQ